MSKPHLTIIGGGPGGYPAAFYAADKGLQVTLIDQETNPGGVCLYRGCIPSKALLHVAKLIEESRQAEKWGVSFGEPVVDLDQLRSFKQGVVDKLTGGLGLLSKQRKINYVQGRARFIDAHTLEVTRADGSIQSLPVDHAVIATGSSVAKIPGLPESDRIMYSKEALDLPKVPEKLLVVGGGYIGLELGSVYNALGSKVSVVEMLPALMNGADKDLTRFLVQKIKKNFNQVLLGTRVVSMEEVDGGIAVTFDGPKVKEARQVFDRVLVSIGRKPNSQDMGLEHTAVKVGERGFIEHDGQGRTAESHLFTIGDVAGQPMLAHKATHEGRVAIDAILGSKAVFEPRAIPAVVFTDPEIAWAGLTEQEATEAGYDIKIGKFPWAASGRCTTLDRKDGLTKIIADQATGRVLGVGLTGPGAGEMIAEGALAVEMGATVEDLAMTIHPHPTLSETVMEAAEAWLGHCTHLVNKK